MSNRKVVQSNLFALILLLLYATAPVGLVPIFKMAKLPQISYLVLPQFLLLIVPTIIYFIITKKSIKETLRLNKIGIRTIVIIIGIGFLAQPIAMFLSLITQFVFPNRISQVVTALNDIPLIIRLGAIALTPAICEEITMRGIVLSGYNNISMRKAAIMTGMFFGMLHLDGNQLLYAFALGIIFAYLVRITNSIYSSMICHFIINGSQVMLQEVSSKLIELSGQQVELTQQAGISSLTTAQLINTFFALLTGAIICIGIIVMLIQKLMKIHGVKDLNNTARGIDSIEEETISSTEEKNENKVFNWPVYIYLIVYIIFIGFELKEIYFR
jgi:membrane protease YdiL (CAAX protease family)